MLIDYLYYLAFVPVLGIIIFVHEFGHLITAKAFGMRVFVFSFGFGKRLAGFKWGDTDCRLSAVPLGGYVKLEGEPDDIVSEDTSAVTVGDGRDFTSRPRWQRFLVYLAGPVMNAVLTIAVFAVFFMKGTYVPATLYDPPVIGAIDPGSPAEAAGLRVADRIVAIDDERPATWEDAYSQIILRPDRALNARVRRGSEERDVQIQSKATSRDGVGSIGVHPLVRIGQIVPGQPAEAAGFKLDDAILAIDDKPITAFEEIPTLVGAAGGRTLRFRIWRDGQVQTLEVTPKETSAGVRIGIGPKFVWKKYGPLGALAEAGRETWKQTRLTFQVVGALLTARLSPKSMMGPIGIAQASGEAAKAGFDWLIKLVAMISLQVGIFNLFPLAPLDGGHLAILAGEGLLRRDFSITVKTWIVNAGVLVMFLLIGLAFYSDLSKMSLFGKLLP
jgi:regulator of sigma E protease